ncbi:hypothetical protein [Paludisphaera rhizosphaerae]|uniref:hypothetical protein n=1 Tax=Paludisphaera rhizosphaerae TaxID=2711216 RepID=UPI0013ECF995|nr:hypothetical protein [Paludisphaera rhizosphaerae]
MSIGAVVAAARRKERILVERLREARAVDAASAVSLPDQNWMGGRVMRRLLKAGALREAGTGYFLDEGEYAAYRSRRKRKTAFIMAPLTIVALLVIWWASTR